MACGCNKRRVAGTPQEILGYRVTLPDGTQVPPADQAGFFSVVEARAEVRRNGGGTVRVVRRGDVTK